jgi:hypothetical protein
MLAELKAESSRREGGTGPNPPGGSVKSSRAGVGAAENSPARPQPLDAILQSLGLSNHDLVLVSAEPLTHKMVQKGRRGRPLTRRIQERITKALNARATPKVFSLDDLFDYRGRL